MAGADPMVARGSWGGHALCPTTAEQCLPLLLASPQTFIVDDTLK